MSIEQIDALVMKGYELVENKQYTTACDRWLEAWKTIKRKIEPAFKKVYDLDERYPFSFFVSNFCQDLEIYLYDAGVCDSVYFEKRIDYCRDFLHYFSERKDLIHHNIERAIAESQMLCLNNIRKPIWSSRKLVQQFPGSVWGYAGWGDSYTEGKRRDYARAKQLYEKALEIAKNNGDKIEIEAVTDRIESLRKN